MFEFKLPDIGEGVSEGEIVKWHVKAGDSIESDQEMVEVMTDKVTVQIPSPVKGTVKSILFQEGQVVQVGSVLIEIETEGGAPEPHEETPSHEVKVESVPAQEEPPRGVVKTLTGLVLASPAVRRIAREKGIDMTRIRGTGDHGRVTLEDLENYNPSEEKPIPMAEPVSEVKVSRVPAEPVAISAEDEILEPRGLRRLIFEKMTKSKQIIPHFTVVEEVDLTRVGQTIAALSKVDAKVTFTSFFIKASAAALKEYPYLNAIYNEGAKNYTLRKAYNIGVAVDTPDGLTVPVIMNVDQKSLTQIAGELADLASRARKGQLKLNEVQNSTFTVSNVGTIGGIISTPIINFPEVAILGVHKVMKSGEGAAERLKTNLSLSCDHRLIDGAMGTRFLVRLKEFLENPEILLLR